MRDTVARWRAASDGRKQHMVVVDAQVGMAITVSPFMVERDLFQPSDQNVAVGQD